MRRTLMLAVLLVAGAVAARPAVAALSTGCCACLEDHKAQTSGPPMAADALFCSQVVGAGYPSFADRCENDGGALGPCLQPTPGASCTATLADAGIACPSGPGAPAAGTGGLAALLLVLGALGLRRLHRRVR